MSIAFIIIGLTLIITGAQNTYAQFGAQLQSDLTGPGNFTYWFASILFVGILGYIPALKSFSTWFMALILLSLFLSNKGFFANVTSALQSGPIRPSIPSETNSGNIISNIINPKPNVPTVSWGTWFKSLNPSMFGIPNTGAQ